MHYLPLRPHSRSVDSTDTYTAQAKHAEFAAKRNRHYGNEAEAMKIAAALAAQEDDEDEEDDSEQQPAAIPPVPPLPNCSRK